MTPIEGLQLPYWAGLWLGIFPTWQGALAQVGALVFVLGSYVAAERLRQYRRARRATPSIAPARPDATLAPPHVAVASRAGERPGAATASSLR